MTTSLHSSPSDTASTRAPGKSRSASPMSNSGEFLTHSRPEALLMSAKFGGVSALVVAIGGGLYVKSSNDYNSKKQYESYARQFEQAMGEVLAAGS